MHHLDVHQELTKSLRTLFDDYYLPLAGICLRDGHKGDVIGISYRGRSSKTYGDGAKLLNANLNGVAHPAHIDRYQRRGRKARKAEYKSTRIYGKDYQKK